ncbi:hypothetical protein DERP_008469 [Dermatophagoides pteronyssinus]|uniref:Uncharacterized protein n=1 Tax=Dermatophagoides pteronyssinus TaxID=6956 RepID=A0ABQ8IVJ4_DERPT|nr:hypothetical protein DERP_008469 [Dermatophagoides pteronyssinus]
MLTSTSGPEIFGPLNPNFGILNSQSFPFLPPSIDKSKSPSTFGPFTLTSGISTLTSTSGPETFGPFKSTSGPEIFGPFKPNFGILKSQSFPFLPSIDTSKSPSSLGNSTFTSTSGPDTFGVFTLTSGISTFTSTSGILNSQSFPSVFCPSIDKSKSPSIFGPFTFTSGISTFTSTSGPFKSTSLPDIFGPLKPNLGILNSQSFPSGFLPSIDKSKSPSTFGPFTLTSGVSRFTSTFGPFTLTSGISTFTSTSGPEIFGPLKPNFGILKSQSFPSGFLPPSIDKSKSPSTFGPFTFTSGISTLTSTSGPDIFGDPLKPNFGISADISGKLTSMSGLSRLPIFAFGLFIPNLNLASMSGISFFGFSNFGDPKPNDVSISISILVLSLDFPRRNRSFKPKLASKSLSIFGPFTLISGDSILASTSGPVIFGPFNSISGLEIFGFLPFIEISTSPSNSGILTSTCGFSILTSTSGPFKSISGPWIFGPLKPNFGIFISHPLPSTSGISTFTSTSGPFKSTSLPDIFGPLNPNFGILNSQSFPSGILNSQSFPSGFLPSIDTSKSPSILGLFTFTSSIFGPFILTSGISTLTSTSGPEIFGPLKPNLGILNSQSFPSGFLPFIETSKSPSSSGIFTSTCGFSILTSTSGPFKSTSGPWIFGPLNPNFGILISHPFPSISGFLPSIDTSNSPSTFGPFTFISGVSRSTSTFGPFTLMSGVSRFTSISGPFKSTSLPDIFGPLKPNLGILNSQSFPSGFLPSIDKSKSPSTFGPFTLISGFLPSIDISRSPSIFGLFTLTSSIFGPFTFTSGISTLTSTSGLETFGPLKPNFGILNSQSFPSGFLPSIDTSKSPSTLGPLTFTSGDSTLTSTSGPEIFGPFTSIFGPLNPNFGILNSQSFPFSFCFFGLSIFKSISSVGIRTFPTSISVDIFGPFISISDFPRLKRSLRPNDPSIVPDACSFNRISGSGLNLDVISLSNLFVVSSVIFKSIISSPSLIFPTETSMRSLDFPRLSRDSFSGRLNRISSIPCGVFLPSLSIFSSVSIVSIGSVSRFDLLLDFFNDADHPSPPRLPPPFVVVVVSIITLSQTSSPSC